MEVSLCVVVLCLWSLVEKRQRQLKVQLLTGHKRAAPAPYSSDTNLAEKRGSCSAKEEEHEKI